MDQDSQIKKYSAALERASWFLVALGMLSEVSTDYAFPSYNIALGFWGAYSSFSKHGRATFGFISFTFLAIILDVVFCSNNRHSSSMFKFCLTMFIFCLFVKIYALYQASLFFTAIGGAYSLDSSNMTASMYESLRGSMTMPGGGGMSPDPEENDLMEGRARELQQQQQQQQQLGGGYYPPNDRHHYAATPSSGGGGGGGNREMADSNSTGVGTAGGQSLMDSSGGSFADQNKSSMVDSATF